MLSSPETLPVTELRVGNNTVIHSEECVKILGIKVDSKLSFNQHVSDCCTKASRQLNALRRISMFLDPKTKLIVLQSFVYSNLNYCPIVWHFCGKQNFSKLEKNP